MTQVEILILFAKNNLEYLACEWNVGFKTEKTWNCFKEILPVSMKVNKKFSTWIAYNMKGMWRIEEKNRQKIREFATAIKMKTVKIVLSQNAGMFLFF